MRKVKDYMTEIAHTISPDDPLLKASELMQFYSIRHLPVTERGKIVGLVSLGDLYAMEAVVAVDPDRTQVRSAMAQDVYQVEPEASLAEVVKHMAEQSLGSAIVVNKDSDPDSDKRGPIGIFTTTDGMRVLAELLADES